MLLPTFCIGEVRGIHCWSCPANEIKLRTIIISLARNSIGEVQPQTSADSELQLMFAGPAPYFANALLYAGFDSFPTKSINDSVVSQTKNFKVRPFRILKIKYECLLQLRKRFEIEYDWNHVTNPLAVIEISKPSHRSQKPVTIE